MRDLGLDSGDCWIIEDSRNGLRAAKAAGCVAVGITTTFNRDQLRESAADVVVDSFDELRRLLQKK
jgi:sugar-phosphatase